MKQQYIIGCDIGTTRVKAVAFSRVGRILGSTDASYAMFHPEPGFAEQDPQQILVETRKVLEQLVSELKGEPMAIVFSSAMHSLMALDEAGQPVSSLWIWADNRSGQLADRLRTSEEGKRQYLRTGIPIHAMTPACKFLWVNTHKPKEFYRANRYAGIKDFVIAQLTGHLVTDYSMAAAMGLMNLESFSWDALTLQSLDIREEQLPLIVSPYHTLEITEGQGILAGIPLVVGGSDGCLANLGSGAVGEGALALTIGTSGAVRRTARTRYLDPAMRTFCYPIDEETFIIGGPTNNGGVVFQWLKDNFFADLRYEEMLAGVDKITPGSDGLLFFPYLLGERAPLWDSSVKGSFHGIEIGHSRYHFARAVMEGILMNLREIASVLSEKDPVRTIYASGGFTQSREYVRMLADIFGAKVALNTTAEAGCAGAALIGLKALGEINDFNDLREFVEVAETVDFEQDRHLQYNEVFARFQKLLRENPHKAV